MVEYLTIEGLKKIKERLKYLKGVKRKEIAERLAAARELGDLSENAEYSSVKEEQGLIESEIRRLENVLKTAIVVEEDPTKMKVEIGSRIIIEIDKTKKEYSVVGSEEANPAEGKISANSPLGKSLFGKKIGEVGSVKTPAGDKKFKIIKIM